jgi:hypothetical protein
MSPADRSGPVIPAYSALALRAADDSLPAASEEAGACGGLTEGCGAAAAAALRSLDALADAAALPAVAAAAAGGLGGLAAAAAVTGWTCCRPAWAWW